MAFLAFSLGIENGLIRSIRGFGFKTTHMTGTFSDLGSMIGYKMQRIPDTGWKIRLELCLVLAFIAGSVLGLLAFDPLLDNAFVVGGCGYIAIGLLYIWLRRRFLKSTTISH